MNAFNGLPLAIRFTILAAIGVVVGGLINAGIYALAWHPRPISPWQRPHPSAPRRQAADFVPILGWLGLARESPIHGRGFWIRPLLIELFCGLGLPALYYWEVVLQSLAPLLVLVAPPPALMADQNFISHAILFALMLVATFIDFDEKTIPDEIMIPGSLIGLLLAAIWPSSHLPVVQVVLPGAARGYLPLLFTSSSDWPAWLNDLGGLALGVAIFVCWCVALIPALATLRRGWWNGMRFYFASIARESAWWKLAIIAVLGSAAIAVVWRGGGDPWQALLTSLVGLGFGGGMVWAVRIAGRLALHKEAMGFGDVTLMAMIGSFLGWQPCLMIFFLSPFIAVIIAVIQYVLTGRRDIPYGPYLCATTAVVILKWPWFWANFGAAFALGWFLPGILATCLVLMAALLTLWRFIERAWSGA